MPEPLDAVLDLLCEDPSCCSERLLHTAGILYAKRSFDSISTRQVTSAAGVNLAAIAYYFGGKDGLQQAVIDHVVAHSNEHIGRIFAELDTAIDGADGDRALLAEATTRFGSDILRTCLPLDLQTWWVAVITRALGLLSPGEEQIYETVFLPCHRVVRKLVEVATGRQNFEHVGIVTEALVGDFLMICRNQPIVLRSLGWENFTPERIEQVAAVVTNRMLGRLNLPTAVAAE
ncbi:MAG TPA: CerR family C-terminal domain-containing protein [Alphaproteobacteria bacterium]|jgi:AcrR family transcriptional regulator|nr:CerR family C-terminal domain-containing protein [Alphaproteobacteria bacterium]